MRALRRSCLMSTAIRPGWLLPASPGRIYFIQVLTKHHLEYQQTPFKRLVSSYLASALDNLNNAENR